MADVYDNKRGTMSSIYSIGNIQVRDNSGTAEVRNEDNTDYAQLSIATPTIDRHAATKLYVDSNTGALIIKRQADCSSAIPNNTTERGYVVVTTAGNGAAIGDVMYDNGLNDSLPMEILAAKEGRTLAITDALSGGSVTFDADSIYVWDEDTTTWLKIGDIGQTTGGVRVIDFAISTTTVDSSYSIPANAVIYSSSVIVTSAYNTGATISVGRTGSTSLLQATTDNKPTKVAQFDKVERIAWGASALPVKATISASSGAGRVVVQFATPNA